MEDRLNELRLMCNSKIQQQKHYIENEYLQPSAKSLIQDKGTQISSSPSTTTDLVPAHIPSAQGQNVNPSSKFGKLKSKFSKSKSNIPSQQYDRSGDDIFNEKYEELTSILDKIRINLDDLEKESAKRVELIASNTKPTDDKLSQIKSDTNDLVQDFHVKLMALTHLVAKNEYVAGSDSKKRMKKLLLSSLSEDFKELFKDFEEIQNQAGEQYNRSIKYQLKVVDPDFTIPEDQQPSDMLLSYLLTDNLTEEGLRLLNERHKQLRSVEQELIELHQLCIGIAELVNQQSDNINSIECFVDRTRESLNEASVDLRKVYKHKKKIRKKKALLVAVIASSFISLGAVLAGLVMKP